MSKFSHDDEDKDDAKAIAIARVFSGNSRANTELLGMPRYRYALDTLCMSCNTQKRTFGHLRKLSSRISLRSPRRLIRDDTLRHHSILC